MSAQKSKSTTKVGNEAKTVTKSKTDPKTTKPITKTHLADTPKPSVDPKDKKIAELAEENLKLQQQYTDIKKKLDRLGGKFKELNKHRAVLEKKLAKKAVADDFKIPDKYEPLKGVSVDEEVVMRRVRRLGDLTPEEFEKVILSLTQKQAIFALSKIYSGRSLINAVAHAQFY